MKIVADTHCHTLASTHAYNTLLEMVRYAKQIGLKTIGLTDHGPAMPDGPHEWHFTNLAIWPDIIEGVRVLKGCEVNVMDRSGQIDLSDEILSKLDWTIASFHSPVYKNPTPEDCLNAALHILKNPYIDVFGHLGTPFFKFDYEQLIARCNEYHKLVELNGNSYFVRKGSSDNCKEIAQLCKKYRVPVILNSDAHICYKIAEVSGPMQMLEEIDFPQDLIVNIDEKRFEQTLNEHLARKKAAVVK